MSHGLQALVSYSFAQSRDMGSTDAGDLRATSVSDVVLPPRTPSDYDIRQSIAGAVSYEVLPRRGEKLGGAILIDWAVDGLVRVMSAPPIDVTVRSFPPMLGPLRNPS